MTLHKNRNGKALVTTGFLLLFLLPVAAQTMEDTTLHKVTVRSENTKYIKTDNVIALRQIAMPTAVIDGKTIAMMGSRRLDEVMREQTGLAVVSDLGAGNRSVGLQMQGFSSEYIMVLIDGQPLAGRNSGNLDLSRISISNIDRIEIIKGASSSLYGSDALGGVVNIITRQFSDHAQVRVGSQYGTYRTWNNTLEGESPLFKNKGAVFFSGNFYRTDGFNVNPYLEKGSQTAPPYSSPSLWLRGRYQLTPQKTLHISARYSGRSSEMTRDYGVMPFLDVLHETDFNGMVALSNRLNNNTRIIGRYYLTRYTSKQHIKLLNGSHNTQTDEFQEYVHRVEWQAARDVWDNRLGLIGGAGGEYMALNSRTSGASGHMYNYYVYAQANYKPLANLEMIAGGRYDGNNLYGGKANPSVGVNYSPLRWLTLRAALGMGYKSPDYKQLYQVFTNITRGYTVVGANVFSESVKELQAVGIVQQLWPIAATVKPLEAETSVSYNTGFTIKPASCIDVNLNLFYNRINNLINYQQVGIKTNGAELYTYVNVANAYTKGLETGVTLRPAKGLTITAGYQLLYAKDPGVIDSIKNGHTRYATVRSSPNIRASTIADYFGLPNRSRHMANVQVFYEIQPWGLNCSVRANYRGKYGFLDTDNNGFIDPYDVFVNGYVLLNASLQKRLLHDKVTLQFSIDNIANYTDYLMPAQPGRIIMAGLIWKCFEQDKK
ncbi:outer membrane receptor for ferrienterochelin and colicins [Filimonas lacunae]|uniref:Outer membrane receptor for ferrienterochelin and colicins n=1 Tax=Filimonas lacunae TaxID=477680 RepID=A0A173MG95_9BACT|nr:TonB-dependent receptor [Filimonas lacunae]BAV06509.1 TonB-dependent receptor [Filimonas lacunae]SIT27215.1 outer membrane receptor for ferrienterochelin and colicins [Filimonas lacunae]